MELQKIYCDFCNKPIHRRVSRLRENLKFGWKQFCSWGCLSDDKKTGVYKLCPVCHKNIWRTPSDFKKSKSGLAFCCQSCAATHNNYARGQKTPKQTCAAETCEKKVARGSIYCSRTCAVSKRRKSIEVTRKEVLFEIKKFEKTNGRIPVKKEMYGAYKKARKAFGTWNKAILVAGFKPNPVLFSQKYTANDGHRCDSLAEKIIDEWFYAKGLTHKRSVPYPEAKKMTCDFVVNNFFIEFFGLKGEHKEYTRSVGKKRKLSKKYNLQLVEIKPTDLFPRNKLDKVLNFLA